MNKKKNRQVSESWQLALLLALSGGLMDAYTYIFRGGVFANARPAIFFCLESICLSKIIKKRCNISSR